MTDVSHLADEHEPAVETVERLCDRLADLGLAIDPKTARDLIRTILAAEAPRLDVRWRRAVGASLDTIRIAAQAALGALATAVGPAPAPAAPPRPIRTPALPAAPAASVPPASAPAAPPVSAPAPPAASPAPSPAPIPESRRPIARRGPRRPSSEEPTPPVSNANPNTPPEPPDLGERRPVFKRPRGR